MDTAAVTRETITFLQGLEANNSRNWFEAHRAEYERHWLGAGLDLIAALSQPCAELGLLAVPKLNASLRRIHRDVRFSRDKRPYEPRLHVILSAGLAFNRAPGVHLVIGPRGSATAPGPTGWSLRRWSVFAVWFASPPDGPGSRRCWRGQRRWARFWIRRTLPACPRGSRRRHGTAICGASR